ncbi:hypothetical protein FQN55_008594 [Onygenales sp. PD_40]|nr:hypothetical protein FQN55_008594 [Onygenales sp. PD_40]KAK2768095.1 hypothetical protein FQN53_006375 [Emmonsiellopsis sp. PD_33]
MENQSPIAKYFKDPFLRLRFKLRRLWRPPPAPTPVVKQNPNEPINKLPLDLIYYLGTSDYLPPADKASLALVCKNFWNVLNGPKVLRRLGRATVGVGWIVNEEQVNQQRLDFLQRLEIRFPKRVLCYPCATFHRCRKPAWCPAWSPGYNLSYISRCDMQNGALRNADYQPILPFTLVQEIMNRHRYGDEYGYYPVTDLEFDSRLIYPRGRDARYSFRARIINDELVVKVDYAVLFRNDSPKDKADAWEWIFSQCKGLRRNWPEYRADLRKQAKECRAFRCWECLAEARLIIDPAYSTKRGEVWLTKYINLGPCRTPFDPKWRRLFNSIHLCYYAKNYVGIGYARFFAGDDASPHRTKCGGEQKLFRFNERLVPPLVTGLPRGRI